jgi:hypothetical protein
LAALLAAPMIASPAAITLTVGATTTCEYGNCTNVDTHFPGGGATASPTVTFTVNGDTYQLLAPFTGMNNSPNGVTFVATPTITYTGATPTAQADNFTIDFLENFTYPGSTTGTYHEASGAVIEGGAVGSSFTAQAFYDGTGLGVLGPFTTTGSFMTAEKSLSGLSGSPLAVDYQFVYDFAAGTTTGGSISAPSSVPEPATYAFALFGGLVLLSARGFKRQPKTV